MGHEYCAAGSSGSGSTPRTGGCSSDDPLLLVFYVAAVIALGIGVGIARLLGLGRE